MTGYHYDDWVPLRWLGTITMTGDVSFGKPGENEMNYACIFMRRCAWVLSFLVDTPPTHPHCFLSIFSLFSPTLDSCMGVFLAVIDWQFYLGATLIAFCWRGPVTSSLHRECVFFSSLRSCFIFRFIPMYRCVNEKIFMPIARGEWLLLILDTLEKMKHHCSCSRIVRLISSYEILKLKNEKSRWKNDEKELTTGHLQVQGWCNSSQKMIKKSAMNTYGMTRNAPASIGWQHVFIFIPSLLRIRVIIILVMNMTPRTCTVKMRECVALKQEAVLF